MRNWYRKKDQTTATNNGVRSTLRCKLNKFRSGCCWISKVPHFIEKRVIQSLRHGGQNVWRCFGWEFKVRKIPCGLSLLLFLFFSFLLVSISRWMDAIALWKYFKTTFAKKKHLCTFLQMKWKIAVYWFLSGCRLSVLRKPV